MIQSMLVGEEDTCVCWLLVKFHIDPRERKNLKIAIVNCPEETWEATKQQ